MNILVIGDIFSKEGRNALKEFLPMIIDQHKINFVVANGENITHGKGISKKDYNYLSELGVDVISSGNHIFRHKDVFDLFKEKKNILRPLNWYKGAPGEGSVLVIKNGVKIRVTNMMGKVFMDYCNNPYEAMDELVAKKDWDIHIVDFHAEASAEKIAFAYNYDGVIDCLYGTHTHVQTADERILPKGTGFITDIGMTGCYESIIGAKIEPIIEKEKHNISRIIEPATGPRQFCGMVLTFEKNKLKKLKRIFLKSGKKL